METIRIDSTFRQFFSGRLVFQLPLTFFLKKCQIHTSWQLWWILPLNLFTTVLDLCAHYLIPHDFCSLASKSNRRNNSVVLEFRLAFNIKHYLRWHFCAVISLGHRKVMRKNRSDYTTSAESLKWGKYLRCDLLITSVWYASFFSF